MFPDTSKKVIAVDVDMVLADIGKVWLKWLNDITGLYHTEDTYMPYDLTVFYQKELHKLKMTGMEFWMEKDLYQKYNIAPVDRAQAYTKALIDLGFTLVPVSYDMGDHGPSKRKWINDYFPFMEDAILCKNKHHIKCDIIIEDRVENLRGFEPPTEAIILKTPYMDYNTTGVLDYYVVEDWKEIYMLVLAMIAQGTRNTL